MTRPAHSSPAAPAVYRILATTANLAADDVLLASLEILEPEYGVHAVRTLLKRQQPGPLKALIERAAALTEIQRKELARHIHLLEAALRECIRSPNETTRINAIELVHRSGAYVMAYLLALGLRSPSSATRGHAASALADLADALAQESSCGNVTWQSVHKAPRHYARLAEAALHREHLLGALRDAVQSYDQHLRLSVLEAALGLSLYLEEELIRHLTDPRGRSWRILQDWLSDAPPPCMAAFVMQALAHEALRPLAARTISSCRHAAFMHALLEHAWLLAEEPIARGARLIKRIEWLNADPCPLAGLQGPQLRQALRLIRASGVGVEQELNWIKMVLLSGHAEHKALAAARALAIDHPISTELLRLVVDWNAPGLARMALREIQRREGSLAAGAEPPSRPARVVHDAPASAGVAVKAAPVRAVLPPGAALPNVAAAALPNVAAAALDLASDQAAASWPAYWEAFERLDWRERHRLGRILIGRGPQAPDFLSGKLESPDPAERVRALQILRLLNLSSAFQEHVISCIRHPSRMVRSAAVKALIHVEHDTAERLLTEALEDPDRRVRANAVETLDELRSARRVDKLTPKLQDPDHRVRAAAIGALLKLRVRDAGESLIALLQNPSKAHRISGLWLVEKLNLASILDRVAQIAETDPDREVRLRARRLLRTHRREQRRARQALLIPPPRTEEGA